MPVPIRPGHIGRGCRNLTITHPPTEACRETAKDQGAEHILSSIKFSKCELQPHVSRIPIRRMGSTDTPPIHNTKASPSSNNPPGGKEVSATMKVWKLLRPGLHRHLSLSGVSEKEGAIHLASKALMKKSTDRNIKYKESAIVETATETTGTQPQVEKTPVTVPDTVNMCETVTLCGEA